VAEMCLCGVTRVSTEAWAGRNPTVAVEATSELTLLMYETDQADAPLLVVPLPRQGTSVCPPKSQRKQAPSAHVFRLQVTAASSKANNKFILAADSEDDSRGWMSALTLDAAACLSLTARNREEAQAQQRMELEIRTKRLDRLWAQMQDQGPEKALRGSEVRYWCCQFACLVMR
jgi:hypothetical protein